MSKNTGLKKLLRYTRTLLGYEGTQTVLIGRDNMNRTDFSSLQIVIDDLETIERVGSFSSYNGETEEMCYAQKISARVSLDFYGDDAHPEHERFLLLAPSQRSYELQRDLGFEVYQQSSVLDLKELTGEQYSQRLRVTLRIQYNISMIESILRIDSLVSSLITN